MAKVFSYNRKYADMPHMGLKDATKQLHRALYGPEAAFAVSCDISSKTMAQFKTGVVVRVPKDTLRYIKSRYHSDISSVNGEDDVILCGNRLYGMAQHGLTKGIKITYTEA